MSSEFRIYFFVILGLFVALLLWLLAWPANAQTLCGPRREVIDAIKQSAQETEVWYGHASGNEKAVMLLLSGKSGSWTLLQVRPDVACVVGAGQGSTPLFGEPA